MKSLEEVMKQIDENQSNGKQSYEGLTSAEIGSYSRHLMFGECTSEDWDESEWSAWVD